MRDSYNINSQKIARQIEESVWIKIKFTDAKPEFVKFYENGTMKAAFSKPKVIPKELFLELTSMIEHEDFDEIYGDILIAESKMQYDDFFNRYYNNI